MKRCPQCEFIYEDDQSLCDMDGVLLVFDSRSLPQVHALATVSAPLAGKALRRNRMVPAFATLLLMLAIGSVYYVSTTRNTAQIQHSPASVTSTTAQPTAETPLPAPSPDPDQTQLPVAEPTPTEERQAAESHKTGPSRAPKPAAAPTKQAAPKPAAVTKPTPKNDDSKVESILKKTGKILKKPFKF